MADVGIGADPAAGRQQADEDALAPMLAPQQLRGRERAGGRLILERRRFGEAAAEQIDAEREQRADHEGNAPAPGGELCLGQHGLQQDRDEDRAKLAADQGQIRSEEHTSELQSLMRNSYAVFCLKKNMTNILYQHTRT